MTDRAYSILLFSGLLAGPASAFIVDIRVLPFFIIFPIAGFCGEARKGTMKILMLITAPVFVLLLGVTSSNGVLTERSLRWIAAIAAGASMSGALGASRASELLFSASKRANPGKLFESLALVVSLAGPFSERIKAVFIESRKKGRSIGDSFATALSSINDIELDGKGSLSRPNAVSAIASCLAWFVLLAGIMEVL